ncbi:hypothetical protein AC482_00120 [miscellaneous Crenarchaeota group-15 archaeon DG-45]|uniref:UPF0215 protein AC482_00120 n=1 Tax=miscellaneous Crenarchaeota group-15 archaeon DG-45 TaxID=1685127 RepID=A0A0M0BTU0_9ARCH|nr:MAG: hypothetical protein AC482_00120 [miscellaneous Crenarchaeota group-15 archaeon DG-45]
MRIAGVEDGSFDAFSSDLVSSTLLCCVLMDHDRIDDIRLSVIEVDGLDATEKLLGMLDGLDTDAVILGGITFGGFNIVDPLSIMRGTGTPVVVYSGKRPDSSSMRSALMKHFEDWRRRWAIIDRLGTVHRTVSRQGEPPIYFEVVGGSAAWADKVLCSSALASRIPEPVRVAGLIARGVS